MDIKSLAKHLPLHGQGAVGSALRALSVAGHLRHARCPAGMEGGQVRWVTLTFWSRTARDNEWWASFVEVEAARVRAVSAVPIARGAVPQQRTAGASDVAPSQTQEPTTNPLAVTFAGSVPGAVTTPTSAEAPEPADVRTAEPGPVAAQEAPPAPVGTPATISVAARDAQPAQHPPAYIALARLGRTDPRLALSAADCTTLEELAAAWFARGVEAAYLTHALTSGLPAQVGSPVGLLRRRLRDKLPPQLPSPSSTAAP